MLAGWSLNPHVRKRRAYATRSGELSYQHGRLSDQRVDAQRNIHDRSGRSGDSTSDGSAMRKAARPVTHDPCNPNRTNRIVFEHGWVW
jgi:hypothetical protein